MYIAVLLIPLLVLNVLAVPEIDQPTIDILTKLILDIKKSKTPTTIYGPLATSLAKQLIGSGPADETLFKQTYIDYIVIEGPINQANKKTVEARYNQNFSVPKLIAFGAHAVRDDASEPKSVVVFFAEKYHALLEQIHSKYPLSKGKSLKRSGEEAPQIGSWAMEKVLRFRAACLLIASNTAALEKKLAEDYNLIDGARIRAVKIPGLKISASSPEPWKKLLEPVYEGVVVEYGIVFLNDYVIACVDTRRDKSGNSEETTKEQERRQQTEDRNVVDVGEQEDKPVSTPPTNGSPTIPVTTEALQSTSVDTHTQQRIAEDDKENKPAVDSTNFTNSTNPAVDNKPQTPNTATAPQDPTEYKKDGNNGAQIEPPAEEGEGDKDRTVVNSSQDSQKESGVDTPETRRRKLIAAIEKGVQLRSVQPPPKTAPSSDPLTDGDTNATEASKAPNNKSRTEAVEDNERNSTDEDRDRENGEVEDEEKGKDVEGEGEGEEEKQEGETTDPQSDAQNTLKPKLPPSEGPIYPPTEPNWTSNVQSAMITEWKFLPELSGAGNYAEQTQYAMVASNDNLASILRSSVPSHGDRRSSSWNERSTSDRPIHRFGETKNLPSTMHHLLLINRWSDIEDCWLHHCQAMRYAEEITDTIYKTKDSLPNGTPYDQSKKCSEYTLLARSFKLPEKILGKTKLFNTEIRTVLNIRKERPDEGYTAFNMALIIEKKLDRNGFVIYARNGKNKDEIITIVFKNLVEVPTGRKPKTTPQ